MNSTTNLEPDLSPATTRFAPSPTGYLHIGGLRTALYNYLWARRTRGTFVLRIEDTDQSRLVPDSIDHIFTMLEKFGISPQESVVHGGPNGPYQQSQRLEIYREHVERMLENGTAYHCFCSSERLDTLRKDQTEAKLPTMYDGLCRHLSAEEVSQKLASNEPHVIRLKVPKHEVVIGVDTIR
jgi:glutamyl/glutaminyl-tRNA synthetase